LLHRLQDNLKYAATLLISGLGSLRDFVIAAVTISPQYMRYSDLQIFEEIEMQRIRQLMKSQDPAISKSPNVF
jgi:hypothetical protein